MDINTPVHFNNRVDVSKDIRNYIGTPRERGKWRNMAIGMGQNKLSLLKAMTTTVFGAGLFKRSKDGRGLLEGGVDERAALMRGLR